MSEYEKLKREFDEEVKRLQENCSHTEVTEWLPYMWAPGHYMGEAKVCKRCGAIVDREMPVVKLPDLKGKKAKMLEKKIQEGWK